MCLSSRAMTPIMEHYRFPQGMPDFGVREGLKEARGFFRFGERVVCYGQSTGDTSSAVNGDLFDALHHVHHTDGTVVLPFDLTQVVNNLRYERYADASIRRRWIENSWPKDVYYRLRPLLPVSFRKHLQKVYLRGWDSIAFPRWP